MFGLIINKYWLDLIFSGKKTWELRGRRTSRRGKIALIQKGSAKIMGFCWLDEVKGPLSESQFYANRDKHQVSAGSLTTLPYENVFAWVLHGAKRLEQPIPYKHKMGAVIWVDLSEISDIENKLV